MHIVALGMNHQTAPIELRERLALTEATQGQVLEAFKRLPAVKEAVVLSTCNRLEIYAVTRSYHEGMQSLIDLLADYSGMPTVDLVPLLYIHHHHEVARHLFRVTCSLDSMILGETQILGQVRGAYQLATDHGTVGKVLHELFQRALRVGKRAHSETAISRHAASISSAAVQLAKERLGDLTGCSVLVIGAGEMAELAAENLRQSGAGRLLFANRTAGRADRLARTYGGEGMGLDGVVYALAQVDIAIVSTAAGHFVLTVPMMQQVTQLRREQPAKTGNGSLVIVDISVPRNVDPAIANLDNVELFDIDDLQTVVADNLRQRELEVPKVEAMIRDEVAAFNLWLRELEIVPLIRSLRQKGEEIRRSEVQRLLDRLPDLDERARRMIELTTVSIVNKILNEPTLRLKASVSDDHGDVYAQALADLFNLPVSVQQPERVS